MPAGRRGTAWGGEPGFRAQPLWPFGRGRQDSQRKVGDAGMHGHLIELAEELVHARPATEDEARAALEWIAARDGKALAELIEERHRLRAPAR
jgi:hypothetical protein